jgi:hypothetical protein
LPYPIRNEEDTDRQLHSFEITPQDGAEEQDCERNAAKLRMASGLPACAPARSPLFRDLHTITAYIVFPSWASLINILTSSKAPPI